MARTKSKTVRKTHAGTAARTPRKAARKLVKRGQTSRSKASKAAQVDGLAKARANTKQVMLFEHLRRPDGATIAELAKATGWQQHSVRGAISGTLKKKLGLAVTSDTIEGRGRVYRILSAR